MRLHLLLDFNYECQEQFGWHMIFNIQLLSSRSIIKPSEQIKSNYCFSLDVIILVDNTCNRKWHCNVTNKRPTRDDNYNTERPIDRNLEQDKHASPFSTTFSDGDTAPVADCQPLGQCQPNVPAQTLVKRFLRKKTAVDTRFFSLLRVTVTILIQQVLHKCCNSYFYETRCLKKYKSSSPDRKTLSRLTVVIADNRN